MFVWNVLAFWKQSLLFWQFPVRVDSQKLRNNFGPQGCSIEHNSIAFFVYRRHVQFDESSAMHVKRNARKEHFFLSFFNFLEKLIAPTVYTVFAGINYKIVSVTNLNKYLHYDTSGTE